MYTIAADRILRNFKTAGMQISGFQGPITSQITYGHIQIRGLDKVAAHTHKELYGRILLDRQITVVC